MKIVIISNYIYPYNSPRSNRATELAKEFSKQGHSVNLYGVLGKYNYTEFEKKYNVKVCNLGKSIFSKLNSDSNIQYDYFFTRLLKKLLNRLIEFPNIFLSCLVYKVLRKETKIDLLITIAMPYPMHWGAALFRFFNKGKYRYTWVADCGDPYMFNPISKPPFYFKYVEKWFCNLTDYISVPCDIAKQGYYPEYLNKIITIPQGFDFSVKISTSNINLKNDIPTFIYAGVFYDRFRDPRPFLDYLSNINYDFKFIIYTSTRNIIDKYCDILKDKLIILDYIPREDLLNEISKCDFVVNFDNLSPNQIPSKLIDYAITGKPILNIEANKPINKQIIDEFLHGYYTNGYIIKDINQYNISNIVNRFIKLVK